MSKQERVRRRNMNLRKLIQPKNALMVLHELVGASSYTVQEITDADGPRCILTYGGQDYEGIGKSHFVRLRQGLVLMSCFQSLSVWFSCKSNIQDEYCMV